MTKTSYLVLPAALLVACGSMRYATNELSGCETLNYREFRMSTNYVGSVGPSELVQGSHEQACITEEAAERLSLTSTICSEAEYLSSGAFSVALLTSVSQIVLSNDEEAAFMPLVSVSHTGQRCSVVVPDHQYYAIFVASSGATFIVPVSEEARNALDYGR